MKKASIFLLFLLTIPFLSHSQDLWTLQKGRNSLAQVTDSDTEPIIQTIALDQNQLDSFLNEFSIQSGSAKSEAPSISFPNEFGKLEKFSVKEVELLSLSRSKEFPTIKTFVGKSLSRNNVHVRWSTSPTGVNVMLDSPEGQFFIQPARKSNSNEHVFYRRDGNSQDDFDRLNCLVSTDKQFNKNKNHSNVESKQTAQISSSQTLKTYRIAVSTTGEFTQYWGDDDDTNGNNQEDAYAQIVSTINRINEVFEMDLGVRLQLVSGINIVYEDPDSDPYGSDFNSEVQQVLNDSIGAQQYDVGHLFDYGDADGDAGSIGSVCSDGRKGSAYTSHPFVDISTGGVFLNDYFDIDFVAHEIGHQFGAYHTFAHQTESAGVNSEPGSGSTIMAYAGVTADDNVQGHSDPYFHYNSIKNIEDYLSRNSCQVSTDIANQPPVVSAGLDVSIPKGTAYSLEAVGSDPDNDALTYCWEQLNSGYVSRSNFGPYLQTGSSNRSYSPTNSPQRTIPAMSRVLAGKLTQTNPQLSSDWETVSLVQRSLVWGVTVRDRSVTSSVSIGQTDRDNRIVSVIENAGPFEVTSQDSNTVVWETGANEVILWDVANTDQAPINTQTVSIYLSTDNGLSFDTLLVSSTLNDGRYDFVVPENINTTAARIKIVPTNNIYFAVNSQSFSILERPFATPFTTISKKSCDQSVVNFNFTLNQYQGFSDAVTFTLTGLPEGINYSITPAVISTNQEQGIVSLTNLSDLLPGEYTLTLVSSSGSTQAQQNFKYIHYKSILNDPVGLSPTIDGGVQMLKPAFSWTNDSNVEQYTVELSLSNTFETLSLSTSTTVSNFTPLVNLVSNTTYYWRVKGRNDCVESNYSEVQSFTTSLIDCRSIGAANLPVALRDATASQNGVTYADVYMANDFVINDLNLEISIEHTYLSDLTLSLIAPDETEVVLVRNIGGTRSNFTNTVFDQEATNTTAGSQAPFTGSYRPSGDLSIFNGQSSFGKWRLKVEDSGPLDTGKIILFNIDFCVNGLILLDEDYDLIPDSSDNCPFVSNQEQVDSDGNGVGDLCDVGTYNNFTLSKYNETCISRNNGLIQISALVAANYRVQVTGPNGFSNEYSFTTNNNLNIPNLESGDYLLCIGIENDPNFERCFTASIEEPEPLQVTSLVNKKDLSLSLSLQGASSYTILVNNQKTQLQSKSQVNLPLRKGLNTIEVTTDLNCQGTFKEEIYIASTSVLYPNPVQEEAYVLIGGTATLIQYTLYDIQANILLDSKVQLDQQNRKIPIDMSALAAGNYFLKIKSNQNEETLRFIKQ